MDQNNMDYLQYDGWTITFSGFHSEKDRSIPTLLCMGNGNIGLRGTIPELEDIEQKGFFAAGFFDKLPRPELDYSTFTPFLRSWSYEEETEKYHLEEALVNCPDVLEGYFQSGGERFVFDESRKEILSRTLDLRFGEVVFSVPVKTASGRHGIVTRKRFVSMKRKAAVFEVCTFEAEDFEGAVKYCAGVDTETENFNISGIYSDAASKRDHAYYRLYDVLEKEEDFYTVIRGRCNGYKLYAAGSIDGVGGVVRLKKGQKMKVLRKAAVICDRIQKAGKNSVIEKLDEIQNLTYSDALKENAEEWARIWESCDICIKGDLRVQTGIRHNLYLLNMSICRDSDAVSVAAKGLTGEGYRGMVFWDTDIHMFPFVLYTQPEAARNLVSFRYRTLDGAREKAEKYGCKGASYPWETGTGGREECEGFLKLITHQLHITADVAYAVGKYIQAVSDRSFCEDEAAELLIETARFWISKGHIEAGKFCISQVSGPDELHLESDNNAYVMNMARHNLELADRAIEEMRNNSPGKWERLAAKIGITEAETEKIREYKNCTDTMKGPDGLYEQCRGFFELEDRIVYEDDPEIVPADTQTVKQADTLMLLYLLPDLAKPDELRVNWEFYEPRTTHTSSLSYGVHGIIAAKLGLEDKAWYYLDKSMSLDLFNPVSNCADGAHLAAAGMSWSAIVNGIAGVNFEENGISISPFLPGNWEELTIPLVYQGCRINLFITHRGVRVRNQNGSVKPASVTYNGIKYEIGKGEEIWL